MSAPRPIFNPPGLPAIGYRCGTFTSFRRAMLDRVNHPDLLASAVTNLLSAANPTDNQISVVDAVNFPISEPFRIKIASEYLTVVSGAGTPVWKVLRGPTPAFHSAGETVILDPENPFLRWQEGIDSDYQTMFIELWSYLADVLTFYQERIANEAFLGTATQRDSLARLAGLIGYRPAPGAGASTLVAFTVAKGKTVSVPANLRVGTRAQPGKSAVTFETSKAITATAANSLLTLAARSRRVAYEPGTVVIQGVNTTLKKNDYLLAVEREGSRGESVHLLRIDSVQPDRAEGFTTIAWHDVAGQYESISKRASLHRFKIVAAHLGHVAPRWEFLPPLLTNINRQFPNVLFENARWDYAFVPDVISRIEIPNIWFYLPAPGDPGNVVHLDRVHEELKYTPQNPGWAVLVTDNDTFQVAQVVDAREAGKTAYSVTSRSTRLTLTQFITPFTFPFRNTQVLTGDERLLLQTDLPLPPVISGNTIEIAGTGFQLQRGQTVIVEGLLAGSEAKAAESAIIATVQVDAAESITFVTLKNPLANSYQRRGSTILANIVEVTQGETVKEEVLGSGNGAAFQTFSLAQKPLTYLPSTDPEGLSAVQSTLMVTVNGVAWQERVALAGSGPEAQDYTTSQDDDGQTSVHFGDGYQGARPPSGTNNIHARYRKGLGRSGNVGPLAIRQLVDSVQDLQSVSNPIPASGGSDAETVSEIRRNAPSSLRTFGRAVSAADFAALAMSYPGIAKASAAWIATDPVTGQSIPYPYVQLTVATTERTPLKGSLLARQLRRFLDNHRDPNLHLRLQDFNPVYVQAAVNVEIDARFPREATLDAVRAALNPGLNADGSPGFFAFERLTFGGAVLLSQLYAAVQAIPGIRSVNVVALSRLGPAFPDAPGVAPHDIQTGPTEVAVIDPELFAGSSLTVTGHGGFADR